MTTIAGRLSTVFALVSLLIAGCFDFSPPDFGSLGDFCKEGSVCDSGLHCNSNNRCEPCQSRAETRCDAGDLYWFDGCGSREDLAEDCRDACENAQCLVCQPRVEARCDEGHVYWFNSCGVREERRDDCHSRGCEDASCKAVALVDIGLATTVGWNGRYLEIAVGKDARPIIAYGLNSAGGGIAVRRWNESAWVQIDSEPNGVITTDGMIQGIDFALVNGERPVLTWIDGTVVTGRPVRVLFWQNGVWDAYGGEQTEIEPLDSVSTWVALAVASDGNPLLAWQSGLPGGSNPTPIFLKRWNGAAWTETPAGSASGSGLSDSYSATNWPGLAVGPGGRELLSFHGNPGDGTTRVAARLHEAGTEEWNYLPGTDLGFASTPTYSGAWADVAFLSSGRPVLVMVDRAGTGLQRSARAVQWTGTEWVPFGSGSVSTPGSHVTQPRIFVDDRDNVIVSYIHWFDGTFQDGAVHIKASRGGSWSEMVPGSGTGRGVSLVGEVPEFLSMAGMGGRVCVAWTYSPEQEVPPFGAHVACAAL